jgi:hypothetical protein
MVQAIEKLNKVRALPRGASLAITQVSSQPDNEVRRFTIRWTTAGLGRVLIFVVRLSVTYDNGKTAAVSEIVAQNRRSVELSVSEIQGFFRVVSFNVKVRAVVVNVNPPKVELITAEQDGDVTE